MKNKHGCDTVKRGKALCVYSMSCDFVCMIVCVVECVYVQPCVRERETEGERYCQLGEVRLAFGENLSLRNDSFQSV